ncbi:MAG TPA: DHHA1 domain-containing protein [Acidobacteriota bacterium]|nr:DHHA1 domain-containing protein [Acidobacteriota bacterium]
MTERIYYTDSFTQEFSSRVAEKLLWEGNPAVRLESTCFYPESGGQPADQGHLNGIAVIAVAERGDDIIHVLEQDQFNENDQVEGQIDWDRRFDHMQQHTGQHILSQAFLRELNGKTESFHLSSTFSTIDLSLESLTREELYRAEDSANQIVFQNRRVRVHSVDPSDQRDLPLRGESERSGKIRVVEIEDFDFSPCGGTHCNRTGEVGPIKILRWERVRKKVRAEFVCGWRAFRDYRWKNRALFRLSRMHSTSDRDVVSTVEKQIERQRELRQQVKALENNLLTIEASQLVNSCLTQGRTKIAVKIWPELDIKSLNRAATLIMESGEDWIILLGTRSPKPALLFARSQGLEEHDMRDWVSQTAHLINGRGGGTPDRAQAGGTQSEGLDDAIAEALKLAQK